MCCLDRKYNRKKCVFKKLPIFPHPLLHYKVDIFSLLTLVLISNCSGSERILKSQNLSPQTHSLLHYKVDIFSFLTVVLIIYSSTPERFLIRRRVCRLFSSYPLRGNFIFLEKYHSDALVFMTIEIFLGIELVASRLISTLHPIHTT